MGSGYKKLYEESEQKRKLLEKLVEDQKNQIELMEKEIEVYKESEEKLQKHSEELIAICEEQNQMLQDMAEKLANREER